MKRLIDKELPFMKHRGWVLAISILLMGLSVFFLVTRKLNYGIDFKGGLSISYRINQETNVGELSKILKQSSLPSFVVQPFESKKERLYLVRVEGSKETSDAEGQGLSSQFTQALESSFGPNQVEVVERRFIGAKVGEEMRNKGIYAILWACIIILAYIGFRFDFYFAPGAIFALVHDVLLTLGAFALTQREVNLTVVAAFLTIVGYSINDTIIVFDRIRENIRRYKGRPLLSIINKSITQTLTRSLLTSLTVFFVVAVLFFGTGGEIQNFAFAMICGVVFGTYSSIFIATPFYYFLRENFGKSKAEHKTQKKLVTT